MCVCVCVRARVRAECVCVRVRVFACNILFYEGSGIDITFYIQSSPTRDYFYWYYTDTCFIYTQAVYTFSVHKHVCGEKAGKKMTPPLKKAYSRI